jgi:hypothetical protein
VEHIPGDAGELLGKVVASYVGPVLVDLGDGDVIDLSKPVPDPFGVDE